MPYSYTQLPGDGSNTNFTFTFGYLSKLHISATVDGTSTPFSWLTDFSIQITPAPAAGTIVEIRRKTPLDEPIVDWSDGSVLTEHDMDLNTLFSLYLAQEAQDGVEATIGLNALGKWDGKGREAINFADPTSDAGLITKGFFDSVYAPSLDAKVTAAANSATASANSAGQSATSAASASLSASDAEAALALFRGQYLGAQASNPTVDGNGDPVTAGDLYFNTAEKEVRVYSGSAWKAAGSVIEGVLGRPPGNVPVIATAGQTSVPVNGGYNAGFIIVTVNGFLMSAPDMDATSGTHLVFTTPMSAGDEVDWFAFGLFDVANTFTKPELMGAGGAGNIGITPSGGIVSTNAQAALVELDSKKAKVAGDGSQVFSVATATQPNHALSLAQGDARYIAAAGVASVQVRQTVASGGTDANGMANFLTAPPGLNVSIIAAPTPLTLCFAAGFNANGAVDYVGRVTATIVSAWSGLAASSTLFLYAERNTGTGTISYGATAFAPVYSTIAPTSPASGQHWFDTSAYVMKLWSGSAWTTVQRLFIGECTTGASAVTSVVTYAINGRYRSALSTGLPPATVATSFLHNLGIPQNNMLGIPQTFAVCATADAGFSVGDVVPMMATVTGAFTGYQPVILTGRNTLALQGGASGTGWCTYSKGAGGTANMVLTSWNFYITANRGW